MLIGISFHRKVSLARDFLHFYDSFYDFFFRCDIPETTKGYLNA